MTITTETFDGVPAGMNLAQPAHELADNEARYLQDILLDKPGIVRRRGPVTAASGLASIPKAASGIYGTLDPAGNYRLCVLGGDGSTSTQYMLSSDFSTYATYAWNGSMPSTPPTTPYRVVDAKPSLTGGVLVGTTSEYRGTGLVQNLAFWRGGINADYSTGTITLTKASATVTGSGTTWTGNVTPGMFLFATHNDGTAGTGRATLTYIGVVKSVDSNTQITLGAVTLYPQGSASLSGLSYVLTSFRGLVPREVKGRATTATASTTVTGANTKFQSGFMEDVVLSSSASTTNASAVVTGISSTTNLKPGMRVQGTNIGTAAYISTVDSATQVTLSVNSTATGATTISVKHGYNLYRSSDLAYIGRLSVVNNDISLTLANNAGVALNNERFIAFNMTGDWSVSNQKSRSVGFLNATYAQRQWYANSGYDASTVSRVWFSDPNDPEGLDLAAYDGDFLDVASSVGTDTPIKALVPAYNALLVIKENETFAIYGTTPTTFSTKKVEDDGTLCGMSAVAYGGGVIWAGREGIHYYDGITVQNLSANKLGDYYKNALRNIDPTKYRMWAMVIRDHYFLFVESMSPNVSVTKGSLSVTPSALTIVINMTTQAFSMFTNLPFRGAAETPADTGKNTIYLVNTTSGATLCNGFSLFDDTGNDTVLGSQGTAAIIVQYGQTSSVDTAGVAATALGMSANTKYLTAVTIDDTCVATSLRVYMSGQGATTTTYNVKGVIYSDTAGSPGALVATTAAVAVPNNQQGGFINFDLSTILPSLTAGTYWIGLLNETGSVLNVHRFATAGSTWYNADTYADGAANPAGVVGGTTTGPLVAYLLVRTVGPDFFFESKKMTQNDAMRKKLFKQLALNYLAQGGALKLDTVIGLNNVGRTSTTTFPASVYTWSSLGSTYTTWDAVAAGNSTWSYLVNSVYRPKRIKFLKRSQMLAFRLWQESPAVTNAVVGPFQIGYKEQRVGRI